MMTTEPDISIFSVYSLGVLKRLQGYNKGVGLRACVYFIDVGVAYPRGVLRDETIDTQYSTSVCIS